MGEFVNKGRSTLPLDAISDRCFRLADFVTTVASLSAALAGAIILLGWIGNVIPLIEVFPGVGADEAIGLMLCGSALFFLRYRTSKLGSTAARGCAISLCLFICVSESFFGLNLHLLLQPFRFSLDPEQLVALPIAINLIVIAIGVLCACGNSVRHVRFSQFLALSTLAVSVGAALAHIYGSTLLQSFLNLQRVSFTSACLLIVLAIALFFSRPDCGATVLITSTTAGGTVVRRLLPVSILTVIFFATVHYFRPDIELLSYAVLVFFVSPILAWLAAAWLDRAALSVRIASEDIQELNQHLNSQVQQLIASSSRINEDLRARSEFLARVSHELRTPLGGIISTAEMLTRTRLTREQRELVEITLQSGEHLLKLISDILDFSSIEAQKMTVENIDLDLFATLTSVLNAMQAKAELKGLSLLSGLSPNVPRIIRGDPCRVRQVLINLIDNAIKFTDRGSVSVQVYVQDRNEGQELRFLVKDNGIGIPAEFCDRLFQPFLQADGSITRRYGGSGLGLSICKSLVELMGGQIGLTSGIGDGSEFWFTLPLDCGSMSSQQRTQPNLEVVTTDGAKGINVLVVEDNPVNAKITVLQLKKLGCNVDVAKNGREAVTSTEEIDFDIVFMDLQMPEMDGLEATRVIRLRELRSKHCVPIIALTAHAMESDRESCLAAGMQDHLTKPPTLAILSAAIERWALQDGAIALVGGRDDDSENNHQEERQSHRSKETKQLAPGSAVQVGSG
jgi:signal transduction histidine kinase/CheY-like chemotaxis protein